MHCECKNYQDNGTDQEVDCLDWITAFKLLPVGTICMVPPHNISEPLPCELRISKFLDTTSQVIEKIDEVSVMFSDYTSVRTGNRCIKRRLSFDHIDADEVGFVIAFNWCEMIVSPEDAVDGEYGDRQFNVTRLSDKM